MEGRGSQGGKKTFAKHGKSHMQAIGARGFEATVNRHFGGDKAEYLRYLHNRANESVMEGYVDRELNRRLEQGQQIACIELPQITDPDEIPW
jgi:hypothetical protein